MGFLDKLRPQATKAVDEHGNQIASGLDKLGDLIDEKTGGKYDDKVAMGESKIEDALDNLDGRDDDIPDRPGAGQHHPAAKQRRGLRRRPPR